MIVPPGGGEGDPDRLLVAALDRLSQEHVPDERRIMSRVAVGRTRPSPTRRFSRRLLPVLTGSAVAVAAVAAVVAISYLSTPDSAPQVGGETSVTPAGPSVATVPTTRRVVPLPTGGTAETSTVPSTTVPTGEGPDPAPVVPGTIGPVQPTTLQPSVANSTPATAVSPSAQPPAARADSAPNQVYLAADGYLDWFVVGSRLDGKVVRLEGAHSGLAEPRAAGSATVRLAPMFVLWRNGAPEQDRAINTTWAEVPASAAAWTIRLVTDLNSDELRVYTGGDAAGLTATVGVAGGPTTTVAVSGAGSVVSVPLGGFGAGSEVVVTIGGSPGTGDVGLAAVAVARR